MVVVHTSISKFKSSGTVAIYIELGSNLNVRVQNVFEVCSGEDAVRVKTLKKTANQL